ncbi:MAG TPA: ATP-binding protein [Anaerolineales bacterium]
MRRNPFFRRLGCFVLIFAFLGMVGFISLLSLAADALGFLQFPFRYQAWAIPAGVLFIILMMMAVARAMRSLLRMSTPLDELLDASRRIAEGDYLVRVEERGIPEMRSLGGAFNFMAERLQADDGRRRAMLADLVHELRTPLTVMRGTLEGMLDGLYPMDSSRLRSVLDETNMMSRLVDDLRTLALAESGALQLRREPTQLAGLVREVAAGSQPQADAAGVKLVLKLDAEPTIDVDPLRVREVLSNVIGNALRYSPRGSEVRIHLTESGAGAERIVQLSVEDEGPGIPAEDLIRIFDRFHKSADSGGMGLGLSIAKYLVQAHGGRIRAESLAASGARISFTLPGQSLVE